MEDSSDATRFTSNLTSETGRLRGAIAFTYFLKNCLDLPRNQDISNGISHLVSKNKSIYK